jgi:formylmethanofuran dehydrogenase subunit E
MVFLKILPLLIPLIIFLIPIIAKNYIKFLFTEKTNKNDLMFECDKCGTYSHESIVIKKEGKNFCSNKCASA